jgi:putative membrane protein
MMYWNGSDAWGWFGMSLGMLLFVILLTALVFTLVRALGHHGPADDGHTSPTVGRPPEQVLAERFARGEIDETEYRKRLATLRSAPPRHG